MNSYSMELSYIEIRIDLEQWFPTWGPRKAVGRPQDVLRSMGGGPQNAYRSTVEKGWEPLI